MDFNAVVDSVTRQVKSMTALRALKYLFYIENKLYLLTGETAKRYGNGVHTKHRHIGYHDFFVRNIDAGEVVCDIGCGDGSVSKDIAVKCPHVKVIAIDNNPKNIAKAIKRHSHDSVVYKTMDVMVAHPKDKVDVVILSNVLEHIKDRKLLLKRIRRNMRPRVVLLRVPMFERDWRVPLKKELGIDYRLDSTHFIEYTETEFREEIHRAGYKVDKFVVNWGEFWAVVSDKES